MGLPSEVQFEAFFHSFKIRWFLAAFRIFIKRFEAIKKREEEPSPQFPKIICQPFSWLWSIPGSLSLIFQHSLGKSPDVLSAKLQPPKYSQSLPLSRKRIRSKLRPIIVQPIEILPVWFRKEGFTSCNLARVPF